MSVKILGSCRTFFAVLILSSFSIAGAAGGSALQCRSLFISALQRSQVQQYLQWEIAPTIPSWAQEKAQSVAPIVEVRDPVLIENSADAQGLLSFFQPREGVVRWLKHPYNKYPVSYVNAPEAGGLDISHTASRSVMSEINGHLVSIKMATDHPFGPTRGQQTSKASELEYDLAKARSRSKLVEDIDQELKPDEVLLVAREILVVSDKDKKNGFIIRDMSQLEDGFLYFPAHQIPNFGKEIAEKNGASPDEFWNKAWAQALAKAQAHQLVRYGFESESTNPQNYLIQLDSQLRPTGRILYRDIVDSHVQAFFMQALGLDSYLQYDKKLGSTIYDALVGVAHNWSLAWKFSDSPKNWASTSAMSKWQQSHTQTYLQEISKLLELKQEFRNADELTKFLKTPEGQAAIRGYHERNKKLK